MIDTVLGQVTLRRAWYHCAACGHGFAVGMMLLRFAVMLACYFVSAALIFETPGSAGGVAVLLGAGFMLLVCLAPASSLEEALPVYQGEAPRLKLAGSEADGSPAGCAMLLLCGLVAFAVLGPGSTPGRSLALGRAGTDVRNRVHAAAGPADLHPGGPRGSVLRGSP